MLELVYYQLVCSGLNVYCRRKKNIRLQLQKYTKIISKLEIDLNMSELAENQFPALVSEQKKKKKFLSRLL